MALKPNAQAVWTFINENDGTDFTAADIAEALGLEVKSVNGILTSAFQKKGIRLTDDGRNWNPDAE